MEKQSTSRMTVVIASSAQIGSNVIIVSRTRMSPGKVCIGGFDLDNRQNIRLLTSAGYQQPDTCELNVGQIIKATFARVREIVPPHSEDVRLVRHELLADGVEVTEFLANFPVVSGSIANTFDGCLSREGSGSLSVREDGVPHHSVCFWKADQALFLDEGYRERYGKTKYTYGKYEHRVSMPFVGFQEALSVIPRGTLVRLSLARWWKPSDAAYADRRCQLQISGWYS